MCIYIYIYICVYQVVHTPLGGSGGLPQTYLTIICTLPYLAVFNHQ